MSARSFRRLVPLAAMAGLALLSGRATAGTYTWTAAASGNWSTVANWDANGVPTSDPTSSLVFNDSPTGYTATDNLAANPFALSSLTFNNLAGHVVNIAGANPLNFQTIGAISVGAGNASIAQAIQLGVVGAPTTLTVSSTGGTLTLTGAVTDVSGVAPTALGSNVVMTGTGTLVFAGTNGVTNSSFGQLSIQGGAVNVTGGTLAVNVPTGTPTALQLGAASGQTASFTASGGATINVAENIFAGDVAGSTGTITITGAGTTLNNNSSNNSINGSNRLAVGQLGTGFLNVLNGGVVNVSLVYAGRGAGSTGTIVVDGPGSAINCDPNPNGLNVGQLAFATGANSTATVTISNGGSMEESASSSAAGNFFLAGGAGSTGNLTLNGNRSSLTISGQAQIGGSGGVAGGTGTLTANFGSVVNLTGPLLLYPNATVNVNTGTFTIGGLDDALVTPVTGETVNLGSANATLTINGRPGQGTSLGQDFYSGTISGSGNVTVTGNTIQGFFGTSTYTGTTNINGGKLSFGALSNLGTGDITFNGGTLQWANNGSANTSDITTGRDVLIFNGGATFDTNFNTITLAGRIGGPATTFSAGGITVTGGGTLILGGTNTYFGPTVIQNGVLVITADANLGSATDNGFNGAPNSVSGTPAGTLIISGTTPVTTSRIFNMNGGTIATDIGQSVTFNGSQVTGATLDGTGTVAAPNFVTGTNGAQFNHVSTTSSVVLSSTSVNDQFFHFNNGGSLSVAAGVNSTGASTLINFSDFNNLGSGSLTIGAGSQVSVANFQSSGLLTLPIAPTGLITLITNRGTSPMNFNGGSRTFIGSPPATFLAGIDLHGNNGIVAGGLFVNNGFVIDSTDPNPDAAHIVADFGALVKGAGYFQTSVVTQNGGKFQSGNSPGAARFGSFVFGPGGVDNYVFAIDDATGQAGPSPSKTGLVSGWGLVKAIKQTVGSIVSSGDFNWTATPNQKLTVALDTLVNPTMVGTDIPGMMADFDPTKSYSWLAASWAGTYSGPTDPALLNAATSFDTSGFLNPVAGKFGWAINPSSDSLSLTYTPSPVPEPSTLALVGVTGIAAGWLRRRRNAKVASKS